VSVVVPFRGDRAAAERLCVALGCLDLQPGDEVIVADNTGRGKAGHLAAGRVRVVPATRERSSYHARNEGARAAEGEWILFLDADCRPEPNLLDAYFAQPVPNGCAAVAGQILGEPDQRSFIARYARSRRLFDHAEGLIRADGGGAAAGNLMVRRTAFSAIGGFTEGIRSGGDLELCRRLQAAGWRLEFRPDALAHHRHRASLPSLLSAIARYGAGARWLNERYPGSSPPWPLQLGLLSAARDVAARLRERRVEEAAFRSVDGLGLVAHRVGYVTHNRAHRSQGDPRHLSGADCPDPPIAPLADRHSPFSNTVRILAAVSRMWSSSSYFPRGQKNPRRPSFRLRGTRWTCRCGTLWLTTLLSATNAPWDVIATRMAPERDFAFANRGATSSSGRSQMVSWCSRGTRSEWPGKSGRWSRNASETSSSKTT
jgi:GT2 family glycosyltransferase